jgi:hypothetical protein
MERVADFCTRLQNHQRRTLAHSRCPLADSFIVTVSIHCISARLSGRPGAVCTSPQPDKRQIGSTAAVSDPRRTFSRRVGLARSFMRERLRTQRAGPLARSSLVQWHHVGVPVDDPPRAVFAPVHLGDAQGVCAWFTVDRGRGVLEADRIGHVADDVACQQLVLE